MIGNIIGSYKITEKIGEGGMGAVFKGIDTMLEREVAIKMLKPELASQPEIVERFRSEAITLAKLNHANIATLYSFVRQGEDFFMVMEFVRGKTLDDVIRKFGAIDCNRAIVLFCQALEGIDHAHRMGIVHRDIKPANIMLTDSGSIKVMDFGIARVLGTARMTRQGNIVGTVEYMAPEQVRGQAADARSDIYSLGILLYEMLTGRVPFESDSEFELMRAQIEDAPKPPRVSFPQIPLAVEQAIMRALAKKPEARPQTAGDLRRALLSTLNASTSNISATVPYAAPTTRVLETPANFTTGERASKKTVSSEESATQLLGGSAPPNKPSRDSVQEFSEARASGSTTGSARQQTVASPTGSTTLLAKLNWKHYAAAALVVIALIAVAASFALRMSRGSEQPAAESANQESETAAETPAPVPAPAETAAPSDPSAATANISASDAARAAASASNSNANLDKAGRPRGNRNEQPEEAQSTAAVPAVVPAPPEASQPPTPAPPTVDTSKKDTEETAPATQNLNKNQKKEEKKKGIGGFFKKVFGSDKKNENKNGNK